MKDRTPEELMILLGRMSGLKKHHSSDQEFIGDLDWRHLIQVVACECILTIQLHMPRNGHSSPENLQSKRHIKDICDKFGIDMTSVGSRTLEFDNVMAGAQVVEDFGGYEESTHEKQAEFAKNRCWCHTCRPITLDYSNMRMVLCPDCGNKRCPKATDHRLACTNSNEAGQEGSIY